MQFFVACAPGLEEMLADELRAIGYQPTELGPGGAEVTSERDFVHRANLELGLAHSIRERIGTFSCQRFDVLVKKVRALPWSEHLSGGVKVDVFSKRSRLYHTKAIEDRVREGIEVSLGHEPKGDTTSTVHVRLIRDRCTVSIDTSGDPLVRRGYRRGTGKAPLRTDLARAIVKLSGWTADLPLVDPFCGSGTIAIEAALLGLNRAPGIGRSFAFEHAPWFDAALFSASISRAREAEHDRPLAIHASDRDAGVIDVARANAERAELGERIVFTHAAISNAPGLAIDDARGVVVTNPPYGHRVSKGRDLRPLFQRLGTRLASKPKWGATMITSDARLAHHAGLGLSEVACFDHGGTRVRVLSRRCRDDRRHPPSTGR